MKIQQFLDSQKEFIEELLERTSRKQVEYARNEDAFHNFKEIATNSFTKSHIKVAWEFNLKHLQSLKDIIEDVEVKNIPVSSEIIDEKIGDIIVYMTLIRDMLREESQANVLLENVFEK